MRLEPPDTVHSVLPDILYIHTINELIISCRHLRLPFKYVATIPFSITRYVLPLYHCSLHRLTQSYMFQCSYQDLSLVTLSVHFSSQPHYREAFNRSLLFQLVASICHYRIIVHCKNTSLTAERYFSFKSNIRTVNVLVFKNNLYSQCTSCPSVLCFLKLLPSLFSLNSTMFN